jgi:hypothetical protein
MLKFSEAKTRVLMGRKPDDAGGNPVDNPVNLAFITPQNQYGKFRTDGNVFIDFAKWQRGSG